MIIIEFQKERIKKTEKKKKIPITKDFFKVPGHKKQCNKIEKAYIAHIIMGVIKPTPMPDSMKLYTTKVLWVEENKSHTKNQEQNVFGLANNKAGSNILTT